MKEMCLEFRVIYRVYIDVFIGDIWGEWKKKTEATT